MLLLLLLAGKEVSGKLNMPPGAEPAEPALHRNGELPLSSSPARGEGKCFDTTSSKSKRTESGPPFSGCWPMLLRAEPPELWALVLPALPPLFFTVGGSKGIILLGVSAIPNRSGNIPCPLSRAKGDGKSRPNIVLTVSGPMPALAAVFDCSRYDLRGVSSGGPMSDRPDGYHATILKRKIIS